MAIVNEVRLGMSEALDRLTISSSDFLDELSGRSPCPKCGRSRKYFCYTCYVCVNEIAQRIPKVKLPIKVDIIKHPREIDGKSTATHAALLAPEDVSIYTYPHFPDYEDKSKVLMVFPGKSSLTFPQLVERFCSRDSSTNIEATPSCNDDSSLVTTNCAVVPASVDGVDLDASLEVNCRAGTEPEVATDCSDRDVNIVKARFPFERVILIDSTWNQVRGIRKDERLQGIVRLELSERESCFWRFQRGKPRTYLATIEAIYYFLVELHSLLGGATYRGQYDDLLFFFKFMFTKIHSLYEPGRMRVYTFQQQKPPSTKQQRRPRATDPSDALR